MGVAHRAPEIGVSHRFPNLRHIAALSQPGGHPTVPEVMLVEILGELARLTAPSKARPKSADALPRDRVSAHAGCWMILTPSSRRASARMGCTSLQRWAMN